MRTTIFNECMMKEETYELCVKGLGLDLPTLEEMGVDKNKPMRLTRVFYFKEEHSIMTTPLAEIRRAITEYYDIDENMIVETTIRRASYPNAVNDGVVAFTIENLTEEVEVEEEVIVVTEAVEEVVAEETVEKTEEELRVAEEIKDFIENKVPVDSLVLLVTLYADEHSRESLLQAFTDECRFERHIETLQEQVKELKHRRKLLKLIPFKTAKVKASIKSLEKDIIDALNQMIKYQDEKLACRDRIDEHLDKIVDKIIEEVKNEGNAE